MQSGELTSRRGPRGPIVLLAIGIVILYGFGFYNLFFLVSPFLPIIINVINIALPWLAGYVWAEIAFVIVLVVLGLILAYGILHLMKRAAAGTLRVLWILQAIVMIAIGPLLFFLFGFFGLFGLFFSFIGVIQLAVWFYRRKKIERAGKLAEFTAQLLLEEKEMFITPLVTAVFSLLTGILMMATWGAMYFWLPLLGIPADSWIFFALTVLVEIPFLFIYFSVFYIFEGINVSIAHTWYRKEDPVLRGGIREVNSVMGTIIRFAAVRTAVSVAQSTIQRGSSRQGGIIAVIGAISSRIIGAIFRLLTYFTLPAIIIDKMDLTDSIKRSARLVWKYLVDVYIKETGVNTVFSFFGGLLSLGFLAVGFLFGYVFGFIFFADLFFSLIAGIIFAILFVIFAAIPSYFIFRPLNTAYNTFMYAYAMDEESNFSLPSRLPKAYADTIEAAQAEWEASGKKRYADEPVFD
ncbi:MAG: hypothetical protein Q6361_05880 [Candidatus Hermodarchaeota archaeon]|nr:hypothetical protein [Candidatus Hermodarchaeota archaeon]